MFAATLVFVNKIIDFTSRKSGKTGKLAENVLFKKHKLVIINKNMTKIILTHYKFLFPGFW